MPLEFRSAYEEDTRSMDGKPGSDYWQNKSVYHIDAAITPSTRMLKGSEKIVYYNNSPDTLNRIVIRLYQNINRPGNERDWGFDEKFFTKGMEISSLSINGIEYNLTDTLITETGTNLIIKGQSIKPGETAKINTTWQFEVPAGNLARMGAYQDFVFFIAYWYPQIAVYDDIDGWDMIEYTGNAEFYNDFNEYDVTITVPNNIGIWATGELQNAAQVLAPNIYLRYQKARESGSVVRIISSSDYNNLIFNNSTTTNTWHFKANDVPDFTFGLSDHYFWDGKKVPDGEKNVFVNAVYDPSSIQFYEVCDVAARTVDKLSHQLPAWPFPYTKISVFNGGGGMESPMMVNEAAGDERIWMVYTTVHEVAHSYFPFYMGINERRYAWMDEGWAQMLSEYIEYDIDTTIDFRQRNTFRYLSLAGKFSNVPPITPTYMVNDDGNSAYFRPCVAYNILQDMLNSKTEGLFGTALREYINRWHGKHPTPYDFFFTFEDVTGLELDWFFQPWFFDQAYPDLGIDSVVFENGKIRVLIEKIGELPVPVLLEVKASDGSLMDIYKTAEVWKSGDDELWIEEELDGKQVVSLELGSMYIPDADKTNNEWKP